MQMDERLDALLAVLSEETYLNVESIAKKLQISERTVRMQVNQLKELLEQNGADIERRRNLGLRIQVKDRETYQAFMKGKTSPVYPQTGRQRVEYIIALFFCFFCLYQGRRALRKDVHIPKNLISGFKNG